MIKYPKTFEGAKPAGFDGLFDWDFLELVFEGTKIMPMDIDAVVERKGKLLIFETKSEFKDIPYGQIITFERLLTIGNGDIHVMIIYGKTADSIVGMDEWYYKSKIIKVGIARCDSHHVIERVMAWFKWANGG